MTATLTVSTASSSSSASLSSASSSSRKRKLQTVATSLPDSVAWLQGLTLDMAAAPSSAASSSGRAFRPCASIQYELSARYADKPVAWSVSRSFDEYVQFQKRLMRTMRRGHVCGAECQWLYRVVKNHFPKTSLFCTRCPERVEARRKAMLRVLTTVQASLLNRGNHRCAVFVNEVSKEFAAFVLGDSATAAALVPVTPSSSEQSTPASPAMSFSSDSSDDEDAASPESPKACTFCGCHSSHDDAFDHPARM